MGRIPHYQVIFKNKLEESLDRKQRWRIRNSSRYFLVEFEVIHDPFFIFPIFFLHDGYFGLNILLAIVLISKTMSVKSNKNKFRRHAATRRLAQRRQTVHTDPYRTGAWQKATPCPDQKMGKRTVHENDIEEHIANQKECSVERACRNRSVCAGIVPYTKRQMRKSSMPVC